MVTPAHSTTARESALRLMADALPHIVWMCDRNGEISFVNRTYREFFGIEEEHARGDGWKDLVHPDDGARYAERWASCVERRCPFHEIVRVRRADGAWRWLESSARPVYEGEETGGALGDLIGFVGSSPDITERVEAEAALRASEEQFRSLTEGMPHGVWMCDAAGQNIYMNSVWYRITGEPPGSGHGMEWLELYHPDDRAELLKEWTATLATGGAHVYDHEARIRSADGGYRWFRIKASPIRNMAGNIVRWVGTCTDIHEQRVLIEALRTSEERFELAALATNDAVYDWDIASGRLTWNEGVRTLFRYEAGQVEETIEWWDAQLHPDDFTRVTAGLKAAMEERGRTLWRDTYRFRRADGTYAELSDRGYFVRDAHGRAVRMIGAMQDLSERARAQAALSESEERFRTLFESIDEGFCIIELLFDEGGKAIDYRFIETNPAFMRQTGLRDPTGKRMRELAPALEEHWYETYGRVATTGVPVRFEKEARSLGRWYDVYAFRTGDPAAHRVAVLFSDITARRRAEEGLVRSNQELQRFASIASHDLKEPLRGVATLASFMLQDEPGLTPEGRARLQRMAQLCGRLTGMIQGLLEYARSGGKRRAEPCDLTEIARRAVDKLAETVRESGAAVTIAPGLPTIEGDPVLLERMFANLVGNALKHGKVTRVEIGAAEPGTRATVYVRDNGVGIDPRHHERIFGLFSRIPAGRSAGVEGLGLGLALVKLIAESHGGRVWVRSGMGEGATFYIRFPGS